MDAPAPPPEIDFPPEFLAEYEVLSELGHGGMSYVFLARQKNLDRRVAIKLLRVNDDFEAEDVERLVREGRVLASMHHPRILGIYGAGSIGELPYLVCELIEGESLAAWVEREKTPLRRALEIVHSVADALTYAHEHGTAHRDVKPENILLLPDGEIKLADFGLARQMAGGKRLTADGMIIGTPSYMSPEQIQGPNVGPESDQYSLGIVAYELLLGVLPFGGETPLEKAFARLKSDAVPPKRVNPLVPAGVDELIVTALKRDPAARFPGMAHLREAVWKALEKLGPEGDEILRPIPRSASRIGIPVRRTGLSPVVDPAGVSRNNLTVPLRTDAPLIRPPETPRSTRQAPRVTRGTPVLASQTSPERRSMIESLLAGPQADGPIGLASGILRSMTGLQRKTQLTGVAVPPPSGPLRRHRRALLGSTLLALLGILFWQVKRDPVRAPDLVGPSPVRRSIVLVPKAGPAPELIELGRDGDALVVRFTTDRPLKLAAALAGAVRHELAREANPGTEHRFLVDPKDVFEPVPLELTAIDGDAEPIRPELAGLHAESRRLRHRLDMGPRTDPLREVLDEWNRAGEQAARNRVAQLTQAARARAARLLELAPILLDCRALELEELHWLYDRVSELRIIDRFRLAFGEKPLGAERALGRTFAVSIADSGLDVARALGGSVSHAGIRLNTLAIVDATDVLAGDIARASPTGPVHIRLATPTAKVARAALELNCAAPRVVDLLWVRLAGWRLLITSDAAIAPTAPGQPGRFYHGLDPRLLSENVNVLELEHDLLPGAPGGQPISEASLASLLVWTR